MHCSPPQWEQNFSWSQFQALVQKMKLLMYLWRDNFVSVAQSFQVEAAYLLVGSRLTLTCSLRRTLLSDHMIYSQIT